MMLVVDNTVKICGALEDHVRRGRNIQASITVDPTPHDIVSATQRVRSCFSIRIGAPSKAAPVDFAGVPIVGGRRELFEAANKDSLV